MFLALQSELEAEKAAHYATQRSLVRRKHTIMDLRTERESIVAMQTRWKMKTAEESVQMDAERREWMLESHRLHDASDGERYKMVRTTFSVDKS